jgi:hypothetical protein
MPPSAFKYLLAEHRRAFFERGSLRIGTLHDYQRTEKYGLAIGDAAEGVLHLTTEFRTLEEHSAHWKEWRRARGQDEPPPTFVKVDSVELVAILRESPDGLVATTQADDCYLFCASSRCSTELMGPFGYDACLEIMDFEGFLRVVSGVLGERADFLGHRPVVYVGRSWSRASHPGVPRVLLKEPEYAYQAEIRALWKPRLRPIAPLLIDAPEARAFCRPC